MVLRHKQTAYNDYLSRTKKKKFCYMVLWPNSFC